MKILVISQYYYPENFRINDICEELVRRGHDVTVLAGIPNYPEGKIFKGYEDSYKKVEIINGVKVYRVNNKPRKTGIINLCINYLSYVKKAKSKLRQLDNDFDLVYVYQLSPVTMISVGLKYAKRHKVPLYTYVCDIWPDSVLESRISRHNIIYVILKWISKRLYKHSDMLGVKCDQFKDYLINVLKINKDKWFLNYEHAESNYLNVNIEPIKNSVIDFMYCGNIGKSSNCSLIIKSAAKLKGNFKIHFVGNGSEYNKLVNLVKDLNLENKIEFYGEQKQTDTIKFYNLADVCLLTLKSDSIVGLTPPAKLTGYMASGRCIIASIDGAAKTIINDSKCGWICKVDDCDKFSELMQNVIDNPSSIAGLGENGRNYFLKKFTLEKHVNELEREFSLLDI